MSYVGYRLASPDARKIVINAAAVRIAIIAIIFRTTLAASSPEKTSRTYRIEIRASTRVEIRAISFIVERVVFDMVTLQLRFLRGFLVYRHRVLLLLRRGMRVAGGGVLLAGAGRFRVFLGL